MVTKYHRLSLFQAKEPNLLKFFHWTLDIVKRFKKYTIFPHIVFAETILFEFGNPKVTVHKCAETIQGRKLYEEIWYIFFLENKKKLFF